MPKKIIKGFTLIELLVVLAIISILSGAGVVGYNKYASTAKDSATKINHTKIVNSMESEFVKCKLDKNSKIFNSHNCNSSNHPSTGTINNYVNNSLGLKNPYDNKQAVVQSNVCTSGSISITEKKTGSYNVAYASIKNKKKYTSLVSSGWSSNYSNTITTSVAYTCASASASVAKGTIDTYKVPEGLPQDGIGAYIVVDKNGKMIRRSYSACTYSYCGNEAEKNRTGGYANLYNRAEGRWYKPGEVKFVLIQANRGTEPYGTVMNSAVPFNSNGGRICTNGDCTYNFADNTFTDNQTGQVFKAGSGKRIK